MVFNVHYVFDAKLAAMTVKHMRDLKEGDIVAYNECTEITSREDLAPGVEVLAFERVPDGFFSGMHINMRVDTSAKIKTLVSMSAPAKALNA